MIYKLALNLHLMVSKECARQLRDEGILSELIMYTENLDGDSFTPGELQQLGNSIIEKIILEGGEETLQYCSIHELLLLVNCHNATAQLASLIMLADLCYWSSMPSYQLISYRQDVAECSCRFKYVNDPYIDCIAVFWVMVFTRIHV